MIKLIALDMDGTLLNNDKHIEEAQKKAIKKAAQAGIKIVLCTGRPLFGVEPLYKELDFDEEEYVILNNGCEIRETKNWSLVDSHTLTKDEIVDLYNFGKGYNLDFTLFDEKHYFCVGKPNEYTVRDGNFVYVPITGIDLDEAISGKYTIFKGMYVGDPEEVDRFQKNIPENVKKLYEFVRSQVSILEAMPSGVNKGTALKDFARRLGIDKSEVMALGDGNNDIEMLEYADFGIAMSNGTEAAKKAAKYVTDTNENDGVAKAIYKYVFNEN